MFRLTPSEETKDPREFAEKWAERMAEAYRIASENSKNSSARGKKYYDQNLKGVILQPGDRVLVRNFGNKGGPGKLRSYWEQTIYIVKEQVKYSQESRILHQNLLHQVNDLPVEIPEIPTGKTKKCKVTRQKDRRTQNRNTDTDDEGSDENYYWARVPDRRVDDSELTCDPPRRRTCNVPTCDIPQRQSWENPEKGKRLTQRKPSPGRLHEQNEFVDSQENECSETETEMSEEDNEQLPESTEPRGISSTPLTPFSDNHTVRVRRSTRDRQPVKRLHYETLGQPLTPFQPTINSLETCETNQIPYWGLSYYYNVPHLNIPYPIQNTPYLSTHYPIFTPSPTFAYWGPSMINGY